MGRRAKERSEEEKLGIVERVMDLMCEGHTVEAAGGIVDVKPGTIRQWILRGGPEVQKRYWEARRLFGSALADEAIEIARNSTNASSTVDKLQIDTFMRVAGKANPVEYGDKQVVEHQGTQKLEIVVREEAKPVRQVSASAQMDAVVATIGQATQNLLVQGNVQDAEFHVEQVSQSESVSPAD